MIVTLRRHSGRKSWRWLLLRHFHLKVFCDGNMRTLHYLVQNFLLLLLFDRGFRLIATALWRSKRIISLAGALADQNVARMNLLLRLAILILGFAFIEFNNVVTKLRLNQITDLSGFQLKRGFLKLRHHCSAAKPS